MKFGWIPDVPDVRDFDFRKMGKISKTLVGDSSIVGDLPIRVDLRENCSPVEDQGNLGSCTAQAVAGLVEYLERWAKSEYIDVSRLFLYKVTRKLYNLEGDTGAYLRGTMKALRLFGACPESYYPYDIKRFDDEPPAFCYAFAQNYQGLVYYRLDSSDVSREDVLLRARSLLAKGVPFVFGFSVYSSIEQEIVTRTGEIPYPSSGDKLLGGHAVMAVGYDSSEKVFLIRNSWGNSWGDGGYGALPDEYFLTGLAEDFWCLLKLEYVSLKGL